MLGTASVARRAAAGSMGGYVAQVTRARDKARRPRSRLLSVGSALSPHNSRPSNKHRIEPLRILALTDCDRIREDVAAAHAFDHADAAARVARQAGVVFGWKFLVRTRSPSAKRAGALAGRPNGARTSAFIDIRRDELARQRLARAERMAGHDLVGVDQAACEQELFQPIGPFLVVRHAEIAKRWQLLDRCPRHVDVPHPGVAHGAVHGESAPLPVGMEHRLVRLRRRPGRTLHAAHVVDAVHALRSWMLFFWRPS